MPAVKTFVTYLLLFFYALTSTGASVYMHQCHGGTVLVTQDNIEEHHKKCPLCNAEGETKPHACDKGKADCCKDIKLDLKKSKDDAENTHASLAFLSLSPAIITLHWILSVQYSADQEIAPKQVDTTKLLVSSSPTYLKHCNFRI
ncbi:hypothetical protein E2P86_15055 [Sphingobacterium psychroaquaticum]|uniref:hypothetical protein n=1 Tax=Sphingobacterium psychroaquaticum TaxID=561061 RepID=UPI00106B8F14|nr:hypothetical protein [Sphingobacterium psychroaquaticum]QBQ42394.1 hypothetical protein E2P86_15055 [Sphingobacterium psychroaquaticum]